jgi:tRNA(fMet)-specific endonuclease VapC
MVLLLDTNIVSYWMRGDQRILSHLVDHQPSDLAISTITLAEILYGIEKSPIKKKERRRKIEAICSQLEIIDFDKLAAYQYGVIRASLEKNGIPISERDLQIGAIALSCGYGIVTHNTKEFRRIKGLSVEDWAEDVNIERE